MGESFTLSLDRSFPISTENLRPKIAEMFRHLRNSAKDYDSRRFHGYVESNWSNAIRDYERNPKRRSVEIKINPTHVLRRKGQPQQKEDSIDQPNDQSAVRETKRLGLLHAGFNSPLQSLNKHNEHEKLKTPETCRNLEDRTRIITPQDPPPVNPRVDKSVWG